MTSPLTASTISTPKSAPLADAEDQHLVERARNGDEAVWQELHRRYYDRLWRSVNQIVRDAAIAEDVVQEAFLKAFRTIDRFKGNSSFSTWIYRIAVNQALDTVRKRSRRQKWLGLFPTQATEEDREIEMVDSTTAFDEAKRRDQREAIQTAIALLPPEQRAVVELRLIQGFSTDETAKILKCRRGTVLSRLYYSCQKLKKSLKGAYDELQ